MNSIELFAVIGGIRLAAEWAGIETKAFCEIKPFAQKVLQKHLPDVPIFDDVRTLNKEALEERELMLEQLSYYRRIPLPALQYDWEAAGQG